MKKLNREEVKDLVLKIRQGLGDNKEINEWIEQIRDSVPNREVALIEAVKNLKTKRSKMNIDKYLKNFQLITREDYRNCDLSIHTKRILCDIGLPKEPLYFIQFNIDEMKNIRLNEEYIMIGNDFGTNICINPKDEIVSIDLEDEYPIRYINKNLETFLEFIITFLSYEDKINDAGDDEINQVMQEIRQIFDRIDIQALSDEENWWPIILEQVESGLM